MPASFRSVISALSAAAMGFFAAVLIARADIAPPRAPGAAPAPTDATQPELALDVDRYMAARTLRCSKPEKRPHLPITVAEAQRRKKDGARWKNRAIRKYYVCLGAVIPSSSRTWKRKGKDAPTRARLAYEIRRRARLVARAMMRDDDEVAALRARDQAKYGSPDGPTFDHLVAKMKTRGFEGDDVYEHIVKSARRTSKRFDRRKAAAASE